MKLKSLDESQVLASRWIHQGPFLQTEVQALFDHLPLCFLPDCLNLCLVGSDASLWLLEPSLPNQREEVCQTDMEPKRGTSTAMDRSTTLSPVHFGEVLLWLTSLSLGRAICPGLALSTGGKYGGEIWNGCSLTLIFGRYCKLLWWDLKLKFVVDDCRVPPNLGETFWVRTGSGFLMTTWGRSEWRRLSPSFTWTWLWVNHLNLWTHGCDLHSLWALICTVSLFLLFLD